MYPQDESIHCFVNNERNALIKQCIERAMKICQEQEIPIEERRVRRKKRMPGEYAEDVGLSAVEEIQEMHVRSYGPVSE